MHCTPGTILRHHCTFVADSWVDASARHSSLSPELLACARSQPSFDAAWSVCERVDWLIDLAGVFDLDDASQRALVVAAVATFSDEPKFLRLRPARFLIAEAWANRRDAESLDLLGTRRFDDYFNATYVYVPIALVAICFIIYRTDWPRWIPKVIALSGIAAIHAVARAWGIVRFGLTQRAIRSYCFDLAERDVFGPARKRARWVYRRMPEQLQHVLVDQFRRGWKRAADFPTPQVKALSET
jgi:hypothetical protein